MVVTSVIFLFFSVKKATLHQEGLALLQENARVLSTIFKEAIMQSGNMGCNRLNALTLTFHEGVHAESLGLANKEAISGISPWELKHFGSVPLKQRRVESDILWIKGTTAFFVPQESVNENQGKFKLKGKTTFQKGDLLVLADCSHADFFKVKAEPLYLREEGKTEIEVDDFGHSLLLGKVYDKSARIGIFNSTLYYVGITNRVNSQGQPIYALYRKTEGKRTQELLEGVERLKIVFATKSANQLVYKSASDLVPSEKIISIQIQALLSTLEPVSESKLNSSGREHDIDGKIRKWFRYEWQV